MNPPGLESRFRMRGWPDAGREAAPREIRCATLVDLRARAVGLLSEGAFERIELAVWNIELNDWVRIETLEA